MLESETSQNQSVSSSPAGWNDPPPATAVTRSAGSRLQLQRQRRPVDPSVLGNSNFVQLGSTSTVASNDVSLQPPGNPQQFHQSRSFPQLHSASNQPQLPPDRPLLGLGTHPGSAFTPIHAMTLGVNHSQSQTSLPNAPILTQTHSTANPQMNTHYNHHHPGNPPQSMDTNFSQLPAKCQPPPQIDLIQNEHQHLQNPMHFTQEQQHHYQLQQQHHRHSFDSASPQIPPIPGTAPTNGQQQQPMIFSPPNIVPLAPGPNGHFPTSLGQTTESENYKFPVKAAGDVSLSGQQLVAFLTKATLLLQQGPTREGIQLRINQFGEFVHGGQISEPCLKKLNFVVDAIDRHIYDEAWQFFEQMLVSFPNDCAIGGWAHGVRLLIQELRKGPIRAHSAGTRLIS